MYLSEIFSLEICYVAYEDSHASTKDIVQLKWLTEIVQSVH
jgi:hypothetical protein